MKIQSVVELTKVNWEKFKNKVSFRDMNTQITYGDLDNYSNIISQNLLQMGLKKQQPVVIIMERSVYYVASIYGILKCGAFFVPINADDDSGRFYTILNDIDAEYVITNEKYYHKVKLFQDKFNKHNLNIILAYGNPCSNHGENTVLINYQSIIDGYNNDLNTMNDSNDIAYVLYTSGSTGKPKGVSTTHGSLINYILESANLFDFNENTKIVSFKPFHFGGAMCDIFCSPYVGGTVYIENHYILPRKIIKAIKEFEATHVSIAPSLIHPLAQSTAFLGHEFQHIKTFSFGADVVQSRDIMELKQELPHVRFFNRYGSTETTVAVAAYEVKYVCEDEPIPIGRPLNNNNFYLVTENNELAKCGEIGELCVGGVQVMKGYWRDEKLTNEVLRTDIVPGELLYKTGDLAYQNNEGNYIFYGRKDFTINKQGYRINLVEIENALLEIKDVSQCVCIAFCKNNLMSIVAFIIISESISMTDISRDIAKYLPHYMMPDKIIPVNDLPYTSSGKPNRPLLIQKYIQNDELK